MARSIDLDELERWLPPRDRFRERILDAFEEAILEYGVQGASFKRIAEHGGFHRTLVHHHFKTRALLVEEAIRRIVDVYLARMSLLLVGVDPDDRLERLLDWLMSPFGDEGPTRQARVVDAYIALAGTDASVRGELRRLYDRFADELAIALKIRCPERGEEALRSTAFTLVGLSFGRAGLDTIGTPLAATWTARRACDPLIEAFVESSAT